MTSNRIFKVSEQVKNIYLGSKAFVILKKNKKTRLMNKKLKERIMLAITEVNGCSMCSFMHTKFALSSGMSKEEIKELLDGNQQNVPVEEAVAVLFGSHFADSKEQPDSEVVERLNKEYGLLKTELIIAVSYVITMTNGMGISMDHLYQRLRLKRNKDSNILNELFNPLLTMILFPTFTILHFLVSFIRKPKILKFQTN